MYRYPLRIAALLLAIGAGVASPLAQADDPPTSNGAVTGHVDASKILEVGLCSQECNTFYDPGKDANDQPMSPPDFYKFTVNPNGDLSSAEPVQAGTYRVVFWGYTYKGEQYGEEGYLKASGSGQYKVVHGAITVGTPFTVTANQKVNLGTFAFAQPAPQGESHAAAYPVSFEGSGFGGEFSTLTVHLKAKRIPGRAELTTSLYGCAGRLAVSHVIKKKGNFPFSIHDGHANKHYGKTFRVEVTLLRAGKRTLLVNRTISAASAHWHCR